MATYTELKRQTVEALLSFYDIGPLISCSVLAGGRANSSLKLKTRHGEFVLSVCDEKSAEEINRLTGLLDYLGSSGFPTTRLIRTRSGEPFISSAEKPVYIKQFIAGQVPDKLSPTLLFQVGAHLARLHELPRPPLLAERFSYGIDSFDEAHGFAKQDGYVEWLLHKAEYLRTAAEAPLPKGVIHGDLFCDNLVVKGERLVALLDFEEACHYFRLFDLGMCAVGCCAPDNRFSLQLSSAIVAGYQSVRPLSELERTHLQDHIEYAAVATSFWRYRQYNIRFPRLGGGDAHQEMVRVADQVHALDSEWFHQQIFFSPLVP